MVTQSPAHAPLKTFEAPTLRTLSTDSFQMASAECHRAPPLWVTDRKTRSRGRIMRAATMVGAFDLN